MMFATGIVALFSILSAASKGAGGSATGLLQALSAYRFLLGIGVSERMWVFTDGTTDTTLLT
jgi:hypothetical protein